MTARKSYKNYPIGSMAPCRKLCGGFVLVTPVVKRHGRYLCLECQGKQRLAWKKNNPEKEKISAIRHSRKWGENNKRKKIAHNFINHSIRNGGIVRPTMCLMCGDVGPTFAHHPDYSRPDWVIWVCRKCHDDLHKLISEHPTAPQAEVTEEDKRAMVEALEHDWLWMERDGVNPVPSIEMRQKIAALILATAPGSTAGKPAPVRVSRKEVKEWAKTVTSEGDYYSLLKTDEFLALIEANENYLTSKLAEKGLVVEPEKEPGQ